MLQIIYVSLHRQPDRFASDDGTIQHAIDVALHGLFDLLLRGRLVSFDLGHDQDDQEAGRRNSAKGSSSASSAWLWMRERDEGVIPNSASNRVSCAPSLLAMATCGN